MYSRIFPKSQQESDKPQESVKPIQNEPNDLGKLTDIKFRRSPEFDEDNNTFWWYIDLEFTNIKLHYTLTNISGEPPAKYVDASIDTSTTGKPYYETMKFRMLSDTPSFHKIHSIGEYTYDEFNSKFEEEYILDKTKHTEGYRSPGIPFYLSNSVMSPSTYNLIKESKIEFTNPKYKDDSGPVTGVTNYTLDTTDMIKEKVSNNVSTQEGGKRHRKRKSTKHSRKHRAKRTRGRKSRR
jgi:hypothetical protein